jgi:formylglycine-generating enzyme required for sulfatase activity
LAADELFERLTRALAGRYVPVRELGAGGMAVVYLAADVKLGREVAIKVLPPDTRTPIGGLRFQREVGLAARFSHPHIVSLFEAGEADGLLYYVMEYIEGESLRDRLAREHRLPTEEALRLTAEVGEALQYAHECGIIHRDVKPANILLAHGHALVTDFGIAKVFMQPRPGESLTGTGVTLGTVEYMSPEQASGSEDVDARTDVYGLAAVLHEMLAGKPPFTGSNAHAVLARVLTDPPPAIRSVRPDVAPHIERALLASLAKDRRDRPSSVRAFVHLLLNPKSAITGGHPAWISAGVLALLLAAGGSFLLQRRPVHSSQAMLRLRGGTYSVGGGVEGSRPRATVALDSFYIDSTEVTVGAYRRFVDAEHAPVPWTRQPPNDWPVTAVLWTEAQAYCRWRTQDGRLPTEDEWEAAARGPSGVVYPWGTRWERGRANADRARDTLAPVGSYPLGRSMVGALDLVGNAWEWTATEGATTAGTPGHVIKGGAFDSPPDVAAAPFRAVFPDERLLVGKTGFRCAVPAIHRAPSAK